MDNSLKSNAPQTSIAKTLIIGIILIILSAVWVVGAENRIIWEITDFFTTYNLSFSGNY